MSQALRIVADGLEILGRPRDLVPAEGVFVGPDGLIGWEDGGGDVRRESVPRPSGLGEFDMPVYEGAMVFSIGGHAIAQDAHKLAVIRDRVTSVGSGGRRFPVSVELQGRTLWTWARRGARPSFVDSGRRGRRVRGSFLLQFVAPVPRKYGTQRDVPAGQVAVNRGNEDAVPRLLIGAGAGGYTVTGPGGRTVVVGTAPAAAHYIDFANGGLYNAAGVRQMGAITVYQPWSIPPGLTGATASINTARSLTTVFADTYN